MNQSLTAANGVYHQDVPSYSGGLSPQRKQMNTKYSQRQPPSNQRAPGGRGLWVPWLFDLADLSTIYASSVDRDLRLVNPGLGLKLALPIE